MNCVITYKIGPFNYFLKIKEYPGSSYMEVATVGLKNNATKYVSKDKALSVIDRFDRKSYYHDLSVIYYK